MSLREGPQALDAGPVASLERFAVDLDDVAGDAYARALELGIPALARALPDAAAGSLATVRLSAPPAAIIADDTALLKVKIAKLETDLGALKTSLDVSGKVAGAIHGYGKLLASL